MADTAAPAKGENEAANDEIRQAAAEKTTKETEAKPEAPVKEDEFEAVAKQADNPDAVRNALKAEREAAKEARERAEELAKKVKDYEDRDKSEQEKLEERASTAEGRATAAEAKLLRFEVATAKGLPSELADRLQGDTKKKLEDDADRLLELVKRKDKPSGDVGAGKGEAADGSDMNELLRAAVRR